MSVDHPNPNKVVSEGSQSLTSESFYGGCNMPKTCEKGVGFGSCRADRMGGA